MANGVDELAAEYKCNRNEARAKKEEISKQLIMAREEEAEVNQEIARIEKALKEQVTV